MFRGKELMRWLEESVVGGGHRVEWDCDMLNCIDNLRSESAATPTQYLSVFI